MWKPVAPDVFGKLGRPSSSITSLTTSAIRAHVLPGVPLARVEVDQEVVGPLDVAHARVPGVQLDAAEVRDPGEAGGVGDDGEVGRAAEARERDPHRLEPVRMRGRDTLLVEELALDAARVALHLHRPARDVVQRERRELDVVARSRSPFVTPDAREVDLLQVGERDLAPADPHRPSAWSRRSARPSAGSGSPTCRPRRRRSSTAARAGARGRRRRRPE